MSEVSSLPALDHMLYLCSDVSRTADHLATVLGVDVGEVDGPFTIVRLRNGVSLNLYARPGLMPVSQHYAFAVGFRQFARILTRLTEQAVPYFKDHAHTISGTYVVGNSTGVYWSDPDGHNLEAITK